MTKTLTEPIALKKLTYNNRVSRIVWSEDEMERMNTIENIQYEMVRKFSYGLQELDELLIQIPKQSVIKKDWKIGLLRNRHILMRFSHEGDFINMMCKTSYNILSNDGYAYFVRPFFYDARFLMDEETTEAMALISFPHRKPTYFVKK